MTGHAPAAPAAPPPVPSSSSATKARLPGVVRRNPAMAAGAAGAVGVALLALRSRAKNGGAAAASSGGTLSQPATPGSPTYDSVASDVYNSMQPQIEQLFAGQEALNERLSNPADILDPASPAASPTPAPSSAPATIATDMPTSTTSSGVPYVAPTTGSDVVGQIGHDYALAPDATQDQRAAALDAWLRSVNP